MCASSHSMSFHFMLACDIGYYLMMILYRCCDINFRAYGVWSMIAFVVFRNKVNLLLKKQRKKISWNGLFKCNGKRNQFCMILEKKKNSWIFIVKSTMEWRKGYFQQNNWTQRAQTTLRPRWISLKRTQSVEKFNFIYISKSTSELDGVTAFMLCKLTK